MFVCPCHSSPGPGSSATSPQQGWLLVWTGPGTVQAAHPGLSSAGGPGSTAIIPGAPSCTVMAWPSKGGTTWSGCVFTQPQVGCQVVLRRQQVHNTAYLAHADGLPAAQPFVNGSDLTFTVYALWQKIQHSTRNCAVACYVLLQVLEALRSQSDYEQFLGSFSAPAELNAAKLPPLWVRGIAAQLRSSDRVSRCAAGVGYNTSWK